MNRKLPRSAGGWGAILYSLKMARRAGGLTNILKALAAKNACKTCALGMGGQKGGMRNETGRFPEVCNKSFQAQAADMQGAIPPDFFARHDIPTLSAWGPQRLELSGRLTCPLLCEASSNRYRPIAWEEALRRVADKIKTTPPERAFFYASGRSSNEAGFLLQLFARLYGTNNVNNCSYYCHQASGVGLSQTLGTGTATIALEDLEHADLVFLIGANPASNHPRFMTLLMRLRRRGGRVVVINPAREPGLVNFRIPSDPVSLLFGSNIASDYLQPHVGGDIATLKGIAKALLKISEARPEVVDQAFIAAAAENYPAYRADIEQTSWESIESGSGLSRAELETVAARYAASQNAVFAWAMGVTHHAHGVENVRSIVNLALLRGMVGRKCAGLLPLRGHSNVQGIGSMGFTPRLKQAVLDSLRANYKITPPPAAGLDTLACMDAAGRGEIDFAWNLGGNLFAANPDSAYAESAFANIDLTLYMNTTLNMGHMRGRGRTTLILPVLARDEEPQPTTQESMFNFVRMSDGGKPRYSGPRGEVGVIAEIAARSLPQSPIPWAELRDTPNVRKVIGAVIPGFQKMLEIDRTREEFHIGGRILRAPTFPTSDGKARFSVCPLPRRTIREENHFMLTTVRSEGQFNTVVYDLFDRYRGAKTRNVVFMNPRDMAKMGLRENDRLAVTSAAGEIKGLETLSYPITPGNIMMYYPEANVLVPRIIDAQSRTPAFKSVAVRIRKDKP